MLVALSYPKFLAGSAVNKRTFAKSLLLGTTAAIGCLTGAAAADLPQRKAAPVEYVRICDTYGTGFFYIPGTDTCLRVGGLVLAEVRAFNPSYSIGGNGFYGAGTAAPAAGFVPGAGAYTNQRTRDAYGYGALGRIELDARTQTSYGTLRTFLRADAYFGSSMNAATGALNGLGGGVINTTAGTTVARETTIINKAFIQFAGLTAGRAQSMFDFYADAYNYDGLRGSNGTVALFAYTATFGGGFSATLSLEDQASRRSPDGSVIPGFAATPAGTRVPDIVGNFRVDQPWGAVQLSAAAHQLNSTLFSSGALATPATAYAFPATAGQNSYGFAVQGGIQLNMDYVAPGDKLWLQAAYEKGAFGYIGGNNLAFSGGPVNGTRFYGAPIAGGADYGLGWNPQLTYDCTYTGTSAASSSCEQQWGWAVVSAFKHYWLPTLSSAAYGSYMEIHFPGNALVPLLGAVGVSNIKEARIGTNLVWTPVKGFDIGGEFMFVHSNQTRPAGLAADATLVATGLPAFRSNNNNYEGRLRVQRAF